MMVDGWQTVKLGEVLTERRETPSPESIETGEISIISKIGFNQGKIELRNETKTKTGMILVSPGDLVISGINAVKGAIAIYGETAQKPIAATIHYGAYIPNQERVDIKYLWWFLRSAAFRDIVQHHIPGGIKTELKAKRFLAVPVLLPPLMEQRRIVRRIEALAARVAEAQSLRREASEEAEALLESAVGKVFSKINGVNAQPLKNLATKIGSGSTPKGGRETYVSEGIPFIRSMNVRMRYFQLDDIAYIDEAIHESMSGTKVKPNDVLLNITGASIGRVACAPEYLDEANVNQHVTIIRPIETLNYKFLMYWFSQPEIQKYINDEQKGATRQGFTKYQIENLNVPVPPLEEQRWLVAYLDGLQAQVSALQVAQAETGKELSALMPSILDKAFKGEL